MILGLLAVLVILACWGLWKSKAVGLVAGNVDEFIGTVSRYLVGPRRRAEYGRDKDELAFIVLFIVLVVILLFPPGAQVLFAQKGKATRGGRKLVAAAFLGIDF